MPVLAPQRLLLADGGLQQQCAGKPAVKTGGLMMKGMSIGAPLAEAKVLYCLHCWEQGASRSSRCATTSDPATPACANDHVAGTATDALSCWPPSLCCALGASGVLINAQGQESCSHQPAPGIRCIFSMCRSCF